MNRNIRILQAFCLFVAGCAALSFSVALFNPDSQACGQDLTRTRCTDAPTLIVVMGAIIVIAISLFVWIGRRKVK